MNALIHLRATRNNALKICKKLDLDQLNLIPESFNNNLVWSLGHILVTQQLLCYRLSGTPCLVSDELIGRYRKGSKPEGVIGRDEIDYIEEMLLSSIDQMKADLAAQRFGHYKPYATSYGIELASIEDAIAFNGIHEARHLGTMLALRKLV